MLIVEVTLDYERKLTSGKYKLLRLYSPEQMRYAFMALDGRESFDYLVKE